MCTVYLSLTGDRHSAAHLYLHRTGRVCDQRKLQAGAGDSRSQCSRDDALQLQLISLSSSVHVLLQWVTCASRERFSPHLLVLVYDEGPILKPALVALITATEWMWTETFSTNGNRRGTLSASNDFSLFLKQMLGPLFWCFCANFKAWNHLKSIIAWNTANSIIILKAESHTALDQQEGGSIIS